MDQALSKHLLFVQCKTMAALLDQRLALSGTDWAWSSIPFDDMENEALEHSRKLMHELLYSPPPRGQS